MSVHKSLRSKSRLMRHRSVLTRFERIAKLEDDERWRQGETVFGLPKVRTFRPKTRKKAVKKEEEVEVAAEEGAEAAPAAAPEE